MTCFGCPFDLVNNCALVSDSIQSAILLFGRKRLHNNRFGHPKCFVCPSIWSYYFEPFSTFDISCPSKVSVQKMGKSVLSIFIFDPTWYITDVMTTGAGHDAKLRAWLRLYSWKFWAVATPQVKAQNLLPLLIHKELIKCIHNRYKRKVLLLKIPFNLEMLKSDVISKT
jgi:hypothetical protein